MIVEKSDLDTVNKVKRLQIAGYGALSLGTLGFVIFDWNGYLEHPLNPDLALGSWAVFLLGLITVMLSKAVEKSNFDTMAKVKIGAVSACAILWFACLIFGGNLHKYHAFLAALQKAHCVESPTPGVFHPGDTLRYCEYAEPPPTAH